MVNITVVGTGYVGLVTGACLADFGNRVTCVDNDPRKLEILGKGDIPFYEPGLKELVEMNRDRDRLLFSGDISGAVKQADVVFIAVGTPPDKDGHADLKYVREVAGAIAEHMDGYTIVVTKSTVPTGTGLLVDSILREKHPGGSFDVVSNPEFLREGSAIGDFMRPDRVVIGASSERAMDVMEKIYRPLYLLRTPIVRTTVANAEMIKYASNAFLALKISYINEIANVCDAVGADVTVVARAMGLDGRISPKFLHAGPGYGGSCFPKDTLALTHIAEKAGYRFRTLEAVLDVNRRQQMRMVEKAQSLLGNLQGKTIAVLGVTFKPNTDDVRDAPSLTIIPEMQRLGATIRAHDPIVSDLPGVTKVQWCADAYDAAKGADCVFLLTEWNEYRDLDLDKLTQSMKALNFMDCRNIYDPRELKDHGFAYSGVGRSFEAAAPWAMEDVLVRKSGDSIPQPEALSERRS
ncbi:UDP-glucose/GDP-mannose dehydrogenase family protein [bacterium]|nr:UDP-glucose/GDP-mannose dehydrogenase family protein [bacterium]